MYDGSKYEGDFKNNNKDGFGILKLANGQIKKGYWESNNFIGSNAANQLF